MNRGLLALMLVLPLAVQAAGVDVKADNIERDARGVIIASGHVEITRLNEVLEADRVRYDPVNHQLEAEGHVRIRSPKAMIVAKSARMDTQSKRGVLYDAVIYLPGGERLAAKRMERVDDTTYIAKKVRFTACPMDQEAWSIAAARAELDQAKGTVTAKHARFEINGMPVLYSPYWSEPLRRTSGFLTASLASTSRRGTEVSLPYYLAPAPNWDATLTPHWMSARGFLGALEYRHVSTAGSENIRLEGIHDKVTARNRSRIGGDISWWLPLSTHLGIEADHISDRDYLSDFSDNAADATKPYLHSSARLSWQGEEADWYLLVRHHQYLIQPSNAATLNILPRFESHWRIPALNRHVLLHLDQETTRFDRRQGVDGWRLDLHPYVELPWHLYGGGLSITLTAGTHHTRYWLRDGTVSSLFERNSYEFGLEARAIFERISTSGRLRHTIEPTLRYDIVNVEDQSGQPNFDSVFGRLTMSNLLSNNHFSGHDRIERIHRISFLVGSRLQGKEENGGARSLLHVRLGASYNLRRQPIDPALQTAAIPLFSNLLGEMQFSPIAGLEMTASGQYDPNGRFWATALASLDWKAAYGHTLHLGYKLTDARYASPETQSAQFSAKLQLARRWHVQGSWYYDLLLDRTQQASGGLGYTHPCWNITVEGYRIHRLSGSSTASDLGVRFLFGFKGLGSVGS